MLESGSGRTRDKALLMTIVIIVIAANIVTIANDIDTPPFGTISP